MASSTVFLLGEYPLPKLILITFAPLSTAYLIALATSLSLSSPSGTVLTDMIRTLSATPSIPILFPLTAPIIPATCVP